MKEKDKNRFKILIAASVVFLILMQGGYLSGFGINPITFTGVIPIGQGKPVDVTQGLYHVLDEGVPANTIIRVYGDAAGTQFIEQVTSATNLITYSTRFIEGQDIWCQARVAAPNSAGAVTYMTPLTKFTIPLGDPNGDARLPNWGLYETTTTVASFVATNQAGHAVTGTGETACLNTTDSALILTISVPVDDTAYGTPADTTDTVTTYMYKAGIFIVLNFNCTQDLLGATWSFSEGTNYYYVYNFAMIENDASDPASGTRAFTINAASYFDNAGGAGINATLNIDIYDGCKLLASGGVDSNSFFNWDSDLNPTAIATLVHQ